MLAILETHKKFFIPNKYTGFYIFFWPFVLFYALIIFPITRKSNRKVRGSSPLLHRNFMNKFFRDIRRGKPFKFGR